MAYTKLKIAPGINQDDSQTANEGRWHDGDLVRFRHGRPEPIGGWTKTVISTTQLAGKVRAFHSWRDNDGYRNLAVGTSTKLYVIRSGAAYDITPFRSERTAQSITAATTMSSAVVTITHTAHGAINGDTVHISSFSSSIGGITPDGEYVLTLVDEDNYTITHGSSASSTASDTRTADLDYEINVGLASSAELDGYGIGQYGMGTWGTARATASEDVIGRARVWVLDNWGEDLVASPTDGSIYVWDRSDGIDNRATEIDDLPVGLTSVNSGIIVTQPDRHLAAIGASRSDVDAPFTVTWSDQEDYTVWTPAATNTAGAQPLTSASMCIRAKHVRGTTLVWTDEDVYAMTFTGPPYTFSFERVGSNCGLLGQNAVAVHNDVAYWMSRSQFYRYDGRISVIPCPIWNHVFGDLALLQRQLIFAALVPEFNEVTWFLPSSGESEVDRYVTYNYVENVWYYGSTLIRTAWHVADLYDLPIAADTSGSLYEQETGTDNAGSALNPYIESGFIDIADGDEIVYVDRMIADLAPTGTARLTVLSRKYPSDSNTSKGTFNVTTSASLINTRIRGREVAIKVDSNATGADWRVGDIRLDISQDGKR